MKKLSIILTVLLFGNASLMHSSAQPPGKINSPDIYRNTRYHRTEVEGVKIFYREAGDPRKPTILLLHGFPSSSHMYRNLIELLAPYYHLIAPDYPGCGMSGKPSAESFTYTFDHLAVVMEKFIDQLGLNSLTFYLQDYGGPIGFRIIKNRPELVSAIVIQNANAYLEGLGPDVQKIGALTEANDTKGLEAVTAYMMSLEGIKEQYVSGTTHPDRISPDSYNMDHFIFEQPGVKDLQKALFNDYGNNFPKYTEWQQYLRLHKPPVLITWGKNDKIFPGAGALAYKKDLPKAEVHLFEGGHFLLEEYAHEVAGLIHSFLQNKTRK
jgi:pimeloyl-ACP methyl ester carboxylesterase